MSRAWGWTCPGLSSLPCRLPSSTCAAMVRIKICGCRTPEDAVGAAEAGADFVGIMFAESRRRVTVYEAGEIVRSLGSPLRALEQIEPPAVHRLPFVAAATDAGLRPWFEHGAEALERMLARKRPLT